MRYCQARAWAAAGQAMIAGLEKGILRWLVDVLAPPRCPLCRAELESADGLCAACWPKLHLIEEPSCPATGLPLAGEWAETVASLPATMKQRPWRTLRAAVFHDAAGRALVHGLKCHDDFAPARLMARLMARRVRDLVEEGMVVAPVPLHRLRLWWRRFNQSAVLARLLAEELALEHVPDLLLRTRYTTPQTRLSGRRRRANLNGAFAVNPRHGAWVRGRTVLLVDDVLTTGATAEACVRALQEAGAGDVHVVVFALAGEPRALHI